MTQNLVIVESPAKAKTIEKYLGPGYTVLASYGHIRDLVNKDGSVLPDDDFAMKWELGARAGKNVNEIKKALKKANALYLATDPDREGEAISWHVKEYLQENNLLGDRQLYRVTFNEITKKAVQAAFDHARDLDTPLIEAYLARRALDYLVGFNLSPVLWRKLPGSKSAGRVQSVALRLICEREAEIEAFTPQEYWSIQAKLHTSDGAPFLARLTHLAGNKLGKFDIGDESAAKAAAARLQNKALSVQKIEKKQVRRSPAPPFITSTMQMEAARKLGMSASQTMRTAQALYEAGLITYMRTDGTTLSEDAVSQARSVIGKEYGDNYVPGAPRLYKSKAKNAQEAHEAIRPTDLSKIPGRKGSPMSDEGQRRLYELIWKRTVASQMENALLDQMSVDISDGTDDAVLRANGSVVAFDGFLKLYIEDQDDEPDPDKEDDKDRRLPPMREGDATKLIDTRENQHFTQPPPRYSEASLVKALEERGIGRPSTYASILQVLRDRNYVTMEKRRFIPEDRGRLVTTFLKKFFTRYVDYDFTANMEEELDAIASGHVAWKEALKLFWDDFKAAVDETKNLTITDVIDHLDADLGPHFFPDKDADGKPLDSRTCTVCIEEGRQNGRLGLKLGKFGAFIGCSNYPDCKFTKPLVVPDKDESQEEQAAKASLSNEPKILGQHPDTGRSVSLRIGPYGPYVQIDPPEDADKKDKPKRQGLPKGKPVDSVTLEDALSLLALPRDIGPHPESGKMIKAGIGRFGPFVQHEKVFASLQKDDDVMHVGMNRAMELLAQKEKRMAEKAAKGEKAGSKTTKKKAPAKKKPAAKKKKAPAKKPAKKS